MADQDRILKHQDFPIARLFEMAAVDPDPASAMVCGAAAARRGAAQAMSDAPTIQHAPPPVVGVDAARVAWGATCGPVAIAAALGLTLDQVRPAVSPGGRFRGYMGIRDVRAALASLGVPIARAWSKPVEPVDVMRIDDALAEATVETGGAPVLVMLRFCGPWDHVPRAAACYRHLIAYRRIRVSTWPSPTPGFVCDVNNPCLADAATWRQARSWRNLVLADLLPERGDERVAVDWMAQV